MMKVIVALLAISCVFAHSMSDNRAFVFGKFKEFMNKFNKKYTTIEEFKARFEVFAKNYAKMTTLDSTISERTHTVGVTRFFDLTETEFRNTYLNLKVTLNDVIGQNRELISHEGTPNADSVDWRKKNAVGPVKDQGSCGSCWAFSAVANIEGQFALKHGSIPNLAEQQLVDCDRAVDQGCNGGFMENAFSYLKKVGGIVATKNYPYHARDESCHFKKTEVIAKITGFKKLDSQDETKIASFLESTGPLSVALDATDLQFYSGGVLSPFFCSPTALNHGVTLVGYGTENGKDFWIVKNSWGQGWGEEGYFRIVRGKGACGINTDVSTAYVQ